jgi:hypothetical protein
MELLLVFLGGFLLGGLAVRFLLEHAARRHLRPHVFDEQYAAAKRVVARHFRHHDTLNLAMMERLMDISGVTALRYLDQLERDGMVKVHGHRGAGAFYTRPN